MPEISTKFPTTPPPPTLPARGGGGGGVGGLGGRGGGGGGGGGAAKRAPARLGKTGLDLSVSVRVTTNLGRIVLQVCEGRQLGTLSSRSARFKNECARFGGLLNRLQTWRSVGCTRVYACSARSCRACCSARSGFSCSVPSSPLVAGQPGVLLRSLPPPCSLGPPESSTKPGGSASTRACGALAERCRSRGRTRLRCTTTRVVFAGASSPRSTRPRRP